MSGQRVPEHPLDTVAWITVRLHATGAVSISGTIGDKRMAHQILDAAKDAITRQVPEKGIIIPNRDVEVVPMEGLRDLGDIPAGQRGDA